MEDYNEPSQASGRTLPDCPQTMVVEEGESSEPLWHRQAPDNPEKVMILGSGG